MNLYQFNCLPVDRRAQLTRKKGTYMAIRQEDGRSIALYHMGEFFVEAWYSVSADRITLIRGFVSRKLLDPYLDLVDISGLTG